MAEVKIQVKKFQRGVWYYRMPIAGSNSPIGASKWYLTRRGAIRAARRHLRYIQRENHFKQKEWETVSFGKYA